MALRGAYHLATGSAVQLSTLVPQRVRQLDVRANPDNAATIYIGGSDVLADGTNAWLALEAGVPWGLKAAGGEDYNLVPDDVYVIGTASDKLHLAFII